jgi:hypothetical protein
VQADYYSPDEARTRHPALPAMLLERDAGMHSRPAIQLYLRTQGTLGNTPKAALLDVLA